MAIMLGPVLQFLGIHERRWGVSLLVVTDTAAPPVLQCAAAGGAFSLLSTLQSGAHVWRAVLAVVQGASAQRVVYRVDGQSYAFHLPADGESPRMAYASCNGFSSPGLMKNVVDKNALWTRLLNVHAGRERINGRSYGPYHLFLMGGDQVYSDALWQDPACPDIVAWSQLTRDQRRKVPWTAALQKQVTNFFENLYLSKWSQPEVAQVLASLPTVMMWDDHDIIDGWGSYPAQDHDCPLYQGVFAIAKNCFSLFQRHSVLGTPPPCTLPGQSAFSAGYRVGTTGLLVLDMRSERSPERKLGNNLQSAQVLSPASWAAAYQWLDAQKGMKHLVVMSSIPVVHPSFELLEKMLGALPGQQELEDDLRDHWTSAAHRAERLRLIHRLFDFSKAQSCRVTLVSGDVHVAAVGVLESKREATDTNAQIINQVTSSGIVHPPPAAMARYFLEHACLQVETVDRGITAAMYEFPTTSRRLIGARNFLTLEPDDAANPAQRLWVNWWVENEPEPSCKVIHPVR
ncbi:MAG: alkaline phosphatase D family protein [Aquabacterium sp.]|nr:alkaline phosphatase D family protein [Aquabacterium sp.]